MPHCFEVELAEKYGLLEAILLNYFRFWVKKNQANDVHFHDGMYWTYNSVRAFCELFPYASKKMIENALNHLEAEGLILTGNFNKSPYDRTKWYTVTEKGMSDCPCEEIDFPHRGNGNPPQGEPIPVNNTVNNNNNEQTDHYESEFAELWKLYPNKKGKKNALKYYIRARKNGTTYEQVEAGIKAYTEYIRKTKAEHYIKHGSTFFNEEGWNDDWSLGIPTLPQLNQVSSEDADAERQYAEELRRREHDKWQNAL